MRPLIVVMGVSGAGKTTVGRAVAARLGLAYVDGDDLHPGANVEKMRAGVALTDADRAPWLAAVGMWLATHDAEGGVASCSALRRRYRDVLRASAPRVWFVHLTASPDVLGARLAARSGHFLPASLLPSQLATLEPLAPDEPGVTLAAQDEAPDALVARALASLPSASGSSGG